MDYAQRLLAMSAEQHYDPAPDGYLEYEDWLKSLPPSERSAETGTNPDDGCLWDSDEETARLERISLYSSVEEYERYEGEDS